MPGDHEQTLDEVLAFVAGQAETDVQLVWRSHQPLGALVGDVPDDDEQLRILDRDPTDVVGLSWEQRNEFWQALPALERVIDLRADNVPQVAWDDDAVLRWAASTQDHDPLTVKITLERGPGGVRATVESRLFGVRFQGPPPRNASRAVPKAGPAQGMSSTQRDLHPFAEHSARRWSTRPAAE